MKAGETPFDCFTAAQMESYARAREAEARAKALEDAAQWYLRAHGTGPGTVGQRIAEHMVDEIRALKDTP